MNEEIIRYEPMIRSLMYRLNILYDREDYMQIGRIAVYEGLSKYDAVKSHSQESYIYGCIRQRLIDEIRKNARYAEKIRHYQSVMLNLDQAQLQCTCFIVEADLKKILNERDFKTFLYMQKGYSSLEIASRLNLSISTIKNIKRNIKEKLQTYLL